MVDGMMDVARATCHPSCIADLEAMGRAWLSEGGISPGLAAQGAAAADGVQGYPVGKAFEGNRADLVHVEAFDRHERLRVQGVADQHLPRSGVVGDPGGYVHRPSVIVALAEDHGFGADADPGRRQPPPLGFGD